MIADKITLVGKTKGKENEDKPNKQQKFYISLEKR